MNPETLVLLSVAIGGICKLVKMQSVANLSKAAGRWHVPLWAIPWLAVALGVLATTAETLFVCDPLVLFCGHTWQQALKQALAGAMAGGFAVAGNETVAKALKAATTKKDAS